MSNNKVLVIENKFNRKNPLIINLRCANYEVLEVHEGNIAINIIKEIEPSIVMLDLVCPGADSFRLCEQLKEQYPFLPVIIVSGSINGRDIDKALESGVDDFIFNPYNPFELNARIRTVLSRTSKEKGKLLKQRFASSFVLERAKRAVYKESQLIKLTEVEWQIMKVLMEQVNKPISKEALIKMVWGSMKGIDDGAVAVNIRRLREKIEADPSNPQYLITIRGLGYYFQDGEIEKIS